MRHAHDVACCPSADALVAGYLAAKVTARTISTCRPAWPEATRSVARRAQDPLRPRGRRCRGLSTTIEYAVYGDAMQIALGELCETRRSAAREMPIDTQVDRKTTYMGPRGAQRDVTSVVAASGGQPREERGKGPEKVPDSKNLASSNQTTM